MTIDRGFAPPADRYPPRFVRCARCQVLQPPQNSAQSRCVACGAPLQRWVAHPPPGVPVTAPRRPPRQRPYLGPPSYRGGHPRWAFPPVVWRAAPDPAPEKPLDDPSGALRGVSWLSAVTAIAALVAAGAEIWRFVLLLAGRTLVLLGDAVRASDVLVAASGIAVPTVALLTAAFAVPALVRTHAVAARRIGREPSRSKLGVVARLLVPLWNVYGAGQIVTEIDRTLALSQPLADGDGERRPRASRITVLWWLSWVLSAALVVATLARGLGGSLQAIADTVELHIAVDLAAAVVAALGALMLRRFARLLTGRPAEYANWVVQPPAPTRPLPNRVADPAGQVGSVGRADPAPRAPYTEPGAVLDGRAEQAADAGEQSAPPG